VRTRNAYWAFAATTLAVGGATFLMSAFPLSAAAFWNFFTGAKAAEPLALHDTSLPLLQAAVNSDPNPSKGGGELALSEGSALVSNGGPEGTAVVYKESAKSSGAISIYVVREGDALSDIADMFGVSTNTILAVNGLKSAQDIHSGDELLILPVSGVRYTIKNSGTLEDVAKLYDVDVEEVARFNGFGPGEVLAAGTEVIVPGVDFAPEKEKAPAKSSGSSSAVATKKPASSASLGDWANPVPGAQVSQGLHGHNGIDLAGVKEGTPVYAASEGKVIAAGNGSCGSGYGVCVIVAHKNNVQTLYAHLSSVTTSVGAAVGKGEHIGGIGNTGRSTGYHLHFEVRGAANPLAR